MNLPVTFVDALAYLYGEEGGYVVDAGGPTKWGVTEAVARAHGYAGDMHDYTQADAAVVYRPAYWDAMHCDELPLLARFAVFDLAVNSGAHEAAVLLQRAVGVKEDGVLGAFTMSAIAAVSPEALLRKLCGYRLALMAGLHNFDVDGRGWIRRVAAILVA